MDQTSHTSERCEQMFKLLMPFLKVFEGENLEKYKVRYEVPFAPDVVIVGHGVLHSGDSDDPKFNPNDEMVYYAITFTGKDFEFVVALVLTEVLVANFMMGDEGNCYWSSNLDPMHCVFARGGVEEFKGFAAIWKLSGNEVVVVEEVA
jgi:hypothetical protein